MSQTLQQVAPSSWGPVRCRHWLRTGTWESAFLTSSQVLWMLWHSLGSFGNFLSSIQPVIPSIYCVVGPGDRKRKNMGPLCPQGAYKLRELLSRLKWGCRTPLSSVGAREGPRKWNFPMLPILTSGLLWMESLVTWQEIKCRYWNQTDLGSPPCSATVWLEATFLTSLSLSVLVRKEWK